jgi:hypothetical protein
MFGKVLGSELSVYVTKTLLILINIYVFHYVYLLFIKLKIILWRKMSVGNECETICKGNRMSLRRFSEFAVPTHT